MDDDGEAFLNAINDDNVTRLKELLDDNNYIFDIDWIIKDSSTALHLAIVKQNLDMVNMFLKYKADVNILIEDRNSCLHLAVETGNRNLVTLFLEHIEIDCVNKLGRTPLHIAVLKNKFEIAELLLNRGADPNTKDVTRDTPLHEAVKYRYVSFIDLLLNNGANPNITNFSNNSAFYESLNYIDENRLDLFLDKGAWTVIKNDKLDNALHIAASSSSEEIVSRLIQRGMDVNETNNFKRTPLHLAILNQNSEERALEVIRLLVDSGADIDALDIKGKTPLYYAVKKNYFDTTKYLLDSRRVSVDGKMPRGIPIFAAVKNGNLAMIIHLVEMGAQVNLKRDSEENLLQVAINCIENAILRFEVVTFLLEQGVNVNNENKYQSSVLLLALKKKDVGLFHYLIKHGACVTAERNMKGETILSTAVDNNLYDVVEYLINTGADVNEQSRYQNPIVLAVKNNNEKVLKLLLNSKASFEKINKKVNILTQIEAAENGFVNMMKILVSYGAVIDQDICIENNERSPLYWAIDYGQPDMVEYLLDLGCNINIREADDNATLPLEVVLRNNRENNDNTKKTVEVIVKHIALLQFSNAYVDEGNMQAINANQWTSDAFKLYIEELTDMKNKTVYRESSVTYFDILSKRNNALVGCLRDKNIINVLKSEDYKKMFLHYSSKLEDHYLNGLQRLQWINEFNVFLNGIFQKILPPLPPEIISQISKFYTPKDFSLCIKK